MSFRSPGHKSAHDQYLLIAVGTVVSHLGRTSHMVPEENERKSDMMPFFSFPPIGSLAKTGGRGRRCGSWHLHTKKKYC